MGRPKLYKTKEEELKAKKISKKKWAKNNKDRVNYIRAKSFTKKFIKISNSKDLNLIEELLQQRREELKDNKVNDRIE
ncbi:hypothetical protein, partial [Clostridium sporogenes]